MPRVSLTLTIQTDGNLKMEVNQEIQAIIDELQEAGYTTDQIMPELLEWEMANSEWEWIGHYTISDQVAQDDFGTKYAIGRKFTYSTQPDPCHLLTTQGFIIWAGLAPESQEYQDDQAKFQAAYKMLSDRRETERLANQTPAQALANIETQVTVSAKFQAQADAPAYLTGQALHDKAREEMKAAFVVVLGAYNAIQALESTYADQFTAMYETSYVAAQQS